MNSQSIVFNSMELKTQVFKDSFFYYLRWKAWTFVGRVDADKSTIAVSLSAEVTLQWADFFQYP